MWNKCSILCFRVRTEVYELWIIELLSLHSEECLTFHSISVASPYSISLDHRHFRIFQLFDRLILLLNQSESIVAFISIVWNIDLTPSSESFTTSPEYAIISNCSIISGVSSDSTSSFLSSCRIILICTIRCHRIYLFSLTEFSIRLLFVEGSHKSISIGRANSLLFSWFVSFFVKMTNF